MLIFTKTELQTRAADAYLKRLPLSAFILYPLQQSSGRLSTVQACVSTDLKDASAQQAAKHLDISHAME